jgi:radical SAM superfamily enzyme YgiQ (UPF0313 family)
VAKRKLVLVNPTLTNPFPGFPPLGLGYVAALTPERWDVEVVDENFEVATFRPCDLVGLTGFTAMANRAYEVARTFRSRGVPVVMGGIHASMMPDEALGHVDAVVVGEAESVWPRVIEDVEAGRLGKRYAGTPVDLAGLVVPRRDLFDGRYVCDSIQTARGCPNDCEFCSVSQFNGFRYRPRPVGEVLDEMATLRRKYLFIVDDNVVGSGSDARAIELARGMVERGFGFAWYSHAALNVADNEDVLRAFSESGCRLLFLGIEAEDRDVLHSMNKKVNLRRDYDRVFGKIHEHHIGIHGSFILGTDEDTIEMLERRADFIRRTHIDVVQYCTLTPYPGTRLFDRLLADGRLLYTDFPSDWDRYDLTEILFEPRRLDIAEYDAFMRGLSGLHGHRSVARRFVRSLGDTRSLGTALWCLFTNEIYAAEPDGRAGRKYWTLSSRTMPLINLYQRLEQRLARRPRGRPRPGAGGS